MSVGLRRKMLFSMTRIRLVEEAIAARYSEQEMRCPVHLSIGQEAVAVGVCAALAREDYLMSTHRGHAHYLARGGGLTTFVAELYGRAAGCSAGRGGSMHLVDLSVNMLGSTPILGGSLPVAVGAAFGSWLQGERRVTAVFFGEAVTEEGVFCESLNFAQLKHLPVLFVCENNLYSVYSPISVRQPPERDRVALAQAHGIPGARVDGNDVEIVHATARTAVQQMREQGGPFYLECDTYRWREHCGPNFDNHIGYRTEAEFLTWRQRCPVETYRARLLNAGELSEAEMMKMEQEILREIEQAFTNAKASPFPSAEQLLWGVYAEGEAR